LVFHSSTDIILKVFIKHLVSLSKKFKSQHKIFQVVTLMAV